MSTNTFDRELILSEEDYERLLKIVARPTNKHQIWITTNKWDEYEKIIESGKTKNIHFIMDSMCADLTTLSIENTRFPLKIFITGDYGYEKELEQITEELERLWKYYFCDTDNSAEPIKSICDKFLHDFYHLSKDWDFVEAVQIYFGGELYEQTTRI